MTGLNIKLGNNVVAELCALAMELKQASLAGKISVFNPKPSGEKDLAVVHLMFAIEGDPDIGTLEFDIPAYLIIGSRPQQIAQFLLKRFTVVAGGPSKP